MEAIDQAPAIERLGQETSRPGPQRFRVAALLRKGRNEDDGDGSPSGDQVILQFNPAHARHSYIRDKT